MARSKVAILKTRPETVVEDYKKLMRLADYQTFLKRDQRVCLKINVSWQIFYPGCSTTPWQLLGVIETSWKTVFQKTFCTDVTTARS